jgi:hypothetical protein
MAMISLAVSGDSVLGEVTVGLDGSGSDARLALSMDVGGVEPLEDAMLDEQLSVAVSGAEKLVSVERARMILSAKAMLTGILFGGVGEVHGDCFPSPAAGHACPSPC